MELHWGFIGAGNVTTVRASPNDAFTQEGSRVVAVMRPSLQRAEEYAHLNNIPRAYSTIEELWADPEVNAVYVCTPPYLHKDHVLAALRGGKHVLCEKPMALSTEDCLTMVEEAKRAGVVFAVAYYRRLYPIIERLREILASGQLGVVTSAQVVKHDPLDPSPEELASLPRFQWMVNGGRSGGILNEMGCHRLDLLLYLLGEASADSAEIGGSLAGQEIEDRAAVTIRFAGGAIAQAYHSWCEPSPRELLAVAGTKGQVVVEDLEKDSLLLQVGGRTETIDVGPRPRATHRAVVADFLQAVRDGRPVRCSGAEATRVSRLIEQAYRSAAEGRTMDLSRL